MTTTFTRRSFLVAALVSGLALPALGPAPLAAGPITYTDKVTTTPSLIQTGFGTGSGGLPDDGLNYCGPDSISMSLLWLGINGWASTAGRSSGRPPLPSTTAATWYESWAA
jgi:hypothetical protein